MIDKFALLIMIISPMEGAFAQSPVEDEMPNMVLVKRIMLNGYGESRKLTASITT
jgi:hypothetical protein